MSIIQTIKDRVSLSEYVQSDGVVLAPSGDKLKGKCPLHDDDTASFFVYSTDTFYCFGCQAGGDIIDYVAHRYNESNKDAISRLANAYNIERNSKRRKQHNGLYAALKDAADTYHKLLLKTPDVLAYLHDRGVTDDDIRTWQIGYAPDGTDRMYKYLKTIGHTPAAIKTAGLLVRGAERPTDLFRDRVMFPIWHQRKIVGFGARTLKANAPKYVNTPDTPIFKKKQILYGLSRARDSIKDKREIIVTEGYLDAISAHRAGYTQTIAAMGTAFDPKLIERMRLDRAVLALDGDSAGANTIDRVLKHIGNVPFDIQIMRLPNGKDLDDVVRSGEIDTLYKNAVSAPEYVVERTVAAVPDGASILDRTRIARAAIAHLVKLEDDIARATSVQMLALNLNLNVDTMLKYAQTVIKPVRVKRERTPLVSPTPEMLVISAILYDMHMQPEINRFLKYIGEPPMSREDFPKLAHIFDTITEAQQQGEDPIQHIINTLGEDALPDNLSPYKRRVIGRQMVRLRNERLHREHFKSLHNVSAITGILKRKGALQKIITG